MKRLIFFILTLTLPLSCTAQTQSLPLSSFQGFVDVVTPDKLKVQFPPDCLNVYTDERGMVVKRRGYRKFNTSPLTGSQPVRKIYVYRKTDGTEYIVANSSWSMFINTTLGTIFNAVKQGLNSSYSDSYATANGVLYRDNGFDGLGGKWNGTTYTDITVANSTSMVTGKYLAYWHNRLFKCGVIADPNVLFYSEIVKPDDFGSSGLNFININKNDGDTITAIFIWNDHLIITKQYSTWEVYETASGEFFVKMLNNAIGCLYGTSVSELKGYMSWVSHRGVEMFDGGNFTLMSESIDNYMRSLPSTVFGENLAANNKTDTTAIDYGKGTLFTNVDTTTINGSITLPWSGNTLNQQNTSMNNSAYLRNTNRQYQTFMTSYTVFLDTISVQLWRTADATGNMELRMGDISHYIPVSEISTSSSWIVLNVSTYNIILTSGTENTLYLNHSAAFAPGLVYWGYDSSVPYIYNRGYFFDFYATQAGAPKIHYGSGGFKIYARTHSSNRAGTFASDISTNTNFRQWSAMESNFTQTGDTGANIQWYVSVATAVSLVRTTNMISATTGFNINSSSGTYVMWVASLTTTNIFSSPRIDDVTLRWYDSVSVSPASTMKGIVYRDRYYLSTSSSSITPTVQNTILCFQKDGTWTRFAGNHAGCFALYNDKLYSGDSRSTGYIYEQDVAGLYSDDGDAIESYYEIKPLDMEIAGTEKWFKWLRLTTSNSSGSLTLSRRLDGWPTWTDFEPIPLTGSGILKHKIQFPNFTKGYFLGLRFGNSTLNENFEVKRMDIEYGVLMPR